MKTYRANGKLLLTGEYLVLKGALAFALPTKMGQTLSVETVHAPSLQWQAFKPDGPWFSATLNPETLEVVETDDRSKADKLAKILKAVREQYPQAFEEGLHFETHLEFDPSWGLGSSSTLLSVLSQWAEINPFELLKMTVGGSGYDIACAMINSPIQYQLDHGQPLIYPVEFNPPFDDRLYFVYQGKKQHSSEEVQRFNQHWVQDDLANEIQTVSKMSMALPDLIYFEDFCSLLREHENIIARCLDREPVQQQFPDFNGVLKSLGAWGGDFLLAATPWSYDQVVKYFKDKGLDTVFKYHDIIL